MRKSFYSELDPNGKYIMLCCFYIFALNGMYTLVLGSLLPLISAEYELSNTFGGTLLSVHNAGTLFAGFIAGIVPFYLGRKRALLFLCSFVVVGFVIMVSSGNPIWLLIGFVFIGISRGSIANFNNAIINEVSGGSMSALNFLHSMFAVGALLAPLLVMFSTRAGDEGWRVAALTIAGLVAIAIALFSRANFGELAQAQRKEKLSYKFLKNRRLWYNIGILFFYLCVESTVNGWIVTYFISDGIMSSQYAQTLAALLWLVILIGRLSIVFFGERVSKAQILILATTGTALFYILLLSTQSLTVITLAIVGLGFSMAGIYPTVIANVGTVIKDYPQSLGVLLLISGIGAIAMPLATGALSDRFGMFAGMSAVVIAIVLMLTLVVIELRGRPAA